MWVKISSSSKQLIPCAITTHGSALGVARVFEYPGTRPDPKNFTRPDDTFLKPEPARVWISKPAGTRLHVFSDEIQIDQQNDHIFWWFPKGKIIYPLLFKAKYFCMAATSVPSERVFFKCMKHFDQKPASLGTECVNELVCLHYVYQTFYD